VGVQALTPLTIGRGRAAASALGALWGFGHSTGQLILGLVFVILKVLQNKQAAACTIGQQASEFESLCSATFFASVPVGLAVHPQKEGQMSS
jgi:hypothetical protein